MTQNLRKMRSPKEKSLKVWIKVWELPQKLKITLWESWGWLQEFPKSQQWRHTMGIPQQLWENAEVTTRQRIAAIWIDLATVKLITYGSLCEKRTSTVGVAGWWCARHKKWGRRRDIDLLPEGWPDHRLQKCRGQITFYFSLEQLHS